MIYIHAKASYNNVLILHDVIIITIETEFTYDITGYKHFVVIGEDPDNILHQRC